MVCLPEGNMASPLKRKTTRSLRRTISGLTIFRSSSGKRGTVGWIARASPPALLSFAAPTLARRWGWIFCSGPGQSRLISGSASTRRDIVVSECVRRRRRRVCLHSFQQGWPPFPQACFEARNFHLSLICRNYKPTVSCRSLTFYFGEICNSQHFLTDHCQ